MCSLRNTFFRHTFSQTVTLAEDLSTTRNAITSDVANDVPAKRLAAEKHADEPPTKRRHGYYEDNNMIEIIVGPRERRFIVQKDPIRAKSRFFQVACSDRWREGQERVVRVPEAHTSTAFKMYLDWTHTNEVSVDDDRGFARVRPLVEFYLLGDVLDDIGVRNEVIRLLTMHHGYNPGLSTQICHSICDNTLSNSPLRERMVDVISSLISPQSFEKSASHLPAYLVLQVAIRAMHLRMRILADGQTLQDGFYEKYTGYKEASADADATRFK